MQGTEGEEGGIGAVLVPGLMLCDRTGQETGRAGLWLWAGGQDGRHPDVNVNDVDGEVRGRPVSQNERV